MAGQEFSACLREDLPVRSTEPYRILRRFWGEALGPITTQQAAGSEVRSPAISVFRTYGLGGPRLAEALVNGSGLPSIRPQGITTIARVEGPLRGAEFYQMPSR